MSRKNLLSHLREGSAIPVADVEVSVTTKQVSAKLAAFMLQLFKVMYILSA